MKTLILFNCLVFATALQIFAQGTTEERKDLHDLIEIRRSKFESYSHSLEQKSGIFGNKTKRDMQLSNEVLSEIVETDNRIISLLNHVVNFRSYEKVNNTYDLIERNEQVQNLERATDTLIKQVDKLTISNAAYKTKTIRLKWSVYGLLLVLLWMFIQNWRNRTAGR